MTEIFAVPAAGPDMEVVRALEDLLDEAREGRVRSIIAVYDVGPTVATLIAGHHDRFMMLGHLSRVQHRVQTQMDYVSEVEE